MIFSQKCSVIAVNLQLICSAYEFFCSVFVVETSVYAVI